MKENRKILFVVPSLEGGGAERTAATLLGRFGELGQDVVLVLFSRRTGYGLPENVRTRYIDIEPRNGLVYSAAKFLSTTARLAAIIRDERPFAVLSFMDYTNIIAVLANALASGGARMIVSVRTSLSLHFGMQSEWMMRTVLPFLIRHLYKRADRIIAVSGFVKNDLVEHFGQARGKVETIYNPVDLDRIIPLSREPVDHPWFREDVPLIVAVGRLSREKGLDWLLKAFARVTRDLSARLVILGRGEEEQELRTMAAELGLRDAVDFPGHQENPYKFMGKADVFVLPSLYEGFPVALVEAMACGVPVVSTVYNPGATEIIEHEKTGLLVPPADDAALAGAIIRLLREKSLGVRLAEGARAWVAELTVARIAERYRDVLLGDEMKDEKITFSFGRNWQDFVRRSLNNERVRAAEDSLTGFLGMPDLAGRTFLDIGCGSGLFSLAAHRLGAQSVRSFDLDPFSVECTRWLKEREGNPGNWSVGCGSILDTVFLAGQEQADVVYSWGVLHHTGSMWRAIENAITLVRPGGLLYLAIYNRVEGILGSKTWLFWKRMYNRWPDAGKRILELCLFILIVAKMVLTLRNPFREFRKYRNERGMSIMTDIRDSLGGYPYEYASPDEVLAFCGKLGLELKNLKTVRTLGCNEFLFRRPPRPQGEVQ
ncbi:MAG: hypothetical protein OHK006_15450 [Thermodesulfovibrionales bacterium]